MADRGLNGNSSLAYRGVRPTTPPNLVIHPRVPNIHDYKEFCIGDIWINSAGRLLTPPIFPGAGDVYILTSVARNVATWIPILGGLMSITGDTGAEVHGDALSNIDLLSNIPNLTFDGDPGTHSIELNSTGGGALAETFTTDDANVVVPDNAGNVIVHGAGNIATTGAGNQITITGADAGAHTFPTDNGNAVEVAGILNVVGGMNVNTSGAGNTITINSTAGIIPWTTIDADQVAVVNNGYITNKVGSRLVLTLPATAAIGDVIYIAGLSTEGWLIAQNAGQQIYQPLYIPPATGTTPGVGGSVGSSTTPRGTIELRCISGGANTIWTMFSWASNQTVV